MHRFSKCEAKNLDHLLKKAAEETGRARRWAIVKALVVWCLSERERAEVWTTTPKPKCLCLENRSTIELVI